MQYKKEEEEGAKEPLANFLFLLLSDESWSSWSFYYARSIRVHSVSWPQRNKNLCKCGQETGIMTLYSRRYV